MKDMPISIRLNKELRKALEELAEKNMRTLSDYVRVVLIEHVRKPRRVKP